MSIDSSQLNYFKQCPLKLMLMNTLRNVFFNGWHSGSSFVCIVVSQQEGPGSNPGSTLAFHFYVVFACPLSATSVLPQSKDVHVKLIHKSKLAVGSSSPESVYIDSFWLKVHKF